MYAKVFAQIFDSSLAEDYQTRHVFMDLLVLADRTGLVDMMPEAISRRTNIPLPVLMSALTKLEAPDPRSRTAENEGRRIVKLDDRRDWGWKIVNFEAYHKVRDENARREKNRVYQQEHRLRVREAAERKRLSALSALSAHVDVDVNEDVDVDVPKGKTERDEALKLQHPENSQEETAKSLAVDVAVALRRIPIGGVVVPAVAEDCAAILRVCRELLGMGGEAGECRAFLLDKAREIGKDKGVRNRVAVFLGWWKKSKARSRA